MQMLMQKRRKMKRTASGDPKWDLPCGFWRTILWAGPGLTLAGFTGPTFWRLACIHSLKSTRSALSVPCEVLKFRQNGFQVQSIRSAWALWLLLAVDAESDMKHRKQTSQDVFNRVVSQFCWLP